MPHAAISALFALTTLAVTLAGCAGSASVGEACNRHSDCDSTLQCAKRVCTPRCERAPDCGDGYACDEDGFCRLAAGLPGAVCQSEVDCAPGLSCQIEVSGAPKQMFTRCAAQYTGAPAGAACTADEDCRNGTCALGRCVDLCRHSRDCADGMSCMSIPHAETERASFEACLPAKGVLSWKIPAPPADGDGTVVLPVPARAEHASLAISTAAPRRAGAVEVWAPSGRQLFRACPSGADTCSDAQLRAQFYANSIRHARDVGLARLSMPSTSIPFETGAYRVRVRSFHPDGTVGPPPSLTAVVRIGPAVMLDLHFYFLDLDQHPCAGAFGNARLDGAAARTEGYFQDDFLQHLRTIFKNNAGIELGTITYEDVDAPELDGIEIKRAGSLLRRGEHATGVNVFFVRNLSPVGISAYGPGPGPAALGRTAKSGIIVGLDTLCYRSWQQLARLTAHEIARYMGLYHNVEIDGLRDDIADSNESPTNLMFYSELGGTSLSPGQRDILLRSPVLR